MKFTIATLIFALSSSVHAQEVDCNNAQSQLAINACTLKDFEKADAELNKVWSSIQKSFTNDDNDKRRKSALLKSQRAWIAYHDADCDGAVAQDWEGGSGRPMAVNMCGTEITNQRTKILRERFGER